MTRRHRLDDDGVAKLELRDKRYTHPDPELPGHYVRVQPNGFKSFVVVARDPRGKQHWRVVGSPPMKIDDARDKGRKIIRSIREAPPDSFEGVAAEYLKRHVHKKHLRSASEIERFLTLHINPAFAGLSMGQVGRYEINRLLDKIEDDHGSRQADSALAFIRQICNWHAARDDHYSSPIVPKMARHGIKKRDRILTDDEIRKVWAAAGTMGNYGRLVKFLLLTGQRREKAAEMVWSDLDCATWTIKSEDREKGNGGVLDLPYLAVVVVGDHGDGDDLVFPGRGGAQISGWSKLKRKLDEVSGVKNWVLHDLRRTARSLMSAAGVTTEHAERVLGHEQDHLVETYDRHKYRAEKAEALAKLSHSIEKMLLAYS
jgi:integrase